MCPLDTAIPTLNTTCSSALYVPRPVSATDNCKVILSTAGMSFNGIYPQGDTTFVLTASDRLNGNAVSCQYTLSVVDMTPPAIGGSPSTC